MVHDHSLQSYHQGCGLCKKEAYPKKVCHVLIEHVSKNKYAYPKKVCHMPIRHVKKKRREKDSPHPRKK